MKEQDDRGEEQAAAAEGDLRVSREDSFRADVEEKDGGMDADKEGTPLLPD